MAWPGKRPLRIYIRAKADYKHAPTLLRHTVVSGVDQRRNDVVGELIGRDRRVLALKAL